MSVFKYLLLLLLISSCSTTLDFQVPTQNFVSPEVVGGKVGARGQMSFGNSTKFKLVTLDQKSIFSSQINLSTDQGSSKDNILVASAAVGIMNIAEIYLKAYPDSPTMYGAKIQLWGHDDGKLEQGIKVSLFGGLGSGEVDSTGITATNGSGVSRSYQATLDIDAYEYGIVAGYRINEVFLPYISAAKRKYESLGHLTSNDYPDVTLTGNAWVESLLFGVQLNKGPAYFLIESGYAKSKWKDSSPRHDYSLGVAGGVSIF